MKTYYYLYKITNLVNTKIYVGVHKTSNLEDGYMGSGKVINRAIEKHGIENFQKDVLEFFETAEAMYAREKEIVTDEFLLREDVYNLRRGGNGGFDYINKLGLNSCSQWSEEARLKKKINLAEKAVDGIGFLSIESKTKSLSTRIKNKQGFHNPDVRMLGCEKAASVESSDKRKASLKKFYSNNDHHSKEKHWITNGTENKFIKSNISIPEGWYVGRILKKHWITNGVENKFVPGDLAIPNGWRKGRNLSTSS